MHIVHCPKGGKVPEGYCRQSCLNYRVASSETEKNSIEKLRHSFFQRSKTWFSHRRNSKTDEIEIAF